MRRHELQRLTMNDLNEGRAALGLPGTNGSAVLTLDAVTSVFCLLGCALFRSHALARAGVVPFAAGIAFALARSVAFTGMHAFARSSGTGSGWRSRSHRITSRQQTGNRTRYHCSKNLALHSHTPQQKNINAPTTMVRHRCSDAMLVAAMGALRYLPRRRGFCKQTSGLGMITPSA